MGLRHNTRNLPEAFCLHSSLFKINGSNNREVSAATPPESELAARATSLSHGHGVAAGLTVQHVSQLVQKWG